MVPSDVAVELSVEQSANLAPGQPIVFVISATNHGPAPVTALDILSRPFTNELELSALSTDCEILGTIVVDTEFSFYYIFDWAITLGGVLEIGETRSCHITVPLSVNAPPVWEFGFSIPDFFVDLDPSNNSASVTLRRSVNETTPLPALSSAVLILLTLLMAAIGVQASESKVRCSAGSR